MGYIPILLALAGFVFLWGILVYNGIKSKGRNLDLTGGNIQRLNAERRSILQNIATIQPGLSGQLREIELLIREENTDSPLSAWQHNETRIQKLQLALIDADGLNDDAEDMLTEFARSGKELRQQVSNYYSGIKFYNQMVTRPPHRFLAIPFGFQPKRTY